MANMITLSATPATFTLLAILLWSMGFCTYAIVDDWVKEKTINYAFSVLFLIEMILAGFVIFIIKL